MNYRMYDKIPKKKMVDMWKYIGSFENMKELVCEIVARGELIVEDNLFIFSTIGDLGVRTLKYAFNVKNQLKEKRELDAIVFVS